MCGKQTYQILFRSPNDTDSECSSKPDLKETSGDEVKIVVDEKSDEKKCD